MRRRAAPSSRIPLLAGALLTAAAVAAGSPVRADGDPFAPSHLRVEGRPLHALGADLTGTCPGKAVNLLVISVAGHPPDEVRRLTLFPCAAGAGGALSALATRVLEPDVVALDVAPVDAAPGAEIVLVDAAGVRVLSASELGGGAGRRLPVPGGLPLPPRTREMGRIRAVGDWAGDGRPVALLPGASGGHLLWLDDGAHRALPLPVGARYALVDPAPPVVPRLGQATFTWPVLARADDDGDGRTDLFALSRYAVWVFRRGADGLPTQPSRRLALRPFSATEELRHETSDATVLASDLDGDGLADLVVHRTYGTLAASRSRTSIHRNPGDGASPDAPADATLDVEGGIAAVELRDLDGDGRDELVRMTVRFGIVQLVRFLATRRVEVDVDVFAPDAAALGKTGAPLAPAWRGDVTLHVDFDEGRVRGLVPVVAGDWNGDGRRDLLYAAGDGAVGVRLGLARAEGGPGFGGTVAEQPFPLTGSAVPADLDGDGLDDLVAWDFRSDRGRILVLHNRGRLPGTRSSLRAAPLP